ncbi:MAG: helix-turn-helix domain-containing protein [Pseudomonadota bacterium]
MGQDTLIGSRIRARRIERGQKQADLAREVGISASYLNLIEHNRRRIGGKLVVDLARALGVETQLLAEGAEAQLLNVLREAAAAHAEAEPEMDRLEDFAGRLPGWARLVQAQHRKIAGLERTVETLSDRLTHDPHLAASLHEMISTVTSIRSTSAILTDTDDIEPEWQSRFQRNIGEDSRRLAESSQALVAYLEASGDAERTLNVPQEELDAFLEQWSYHFPPLERALAADPQAMVANAAEFETAAGRSLGIEYLARYRRDAEAMPLDAFRAAALDCNYDPADLSRRFGVDLPSVFRRLASLPTEQGEPTIALALADGSGALTFRKGTDGFPLPRHGAGCPLWPIYQALSRPMAPVRAALSHAGTGGKAFLVYAISQPLYPGGFDGPQVFEASMLILPEALVGMTGLPLQEVGSNCRVCPLGDCPARREPSIMADAF